LKRLKEQVTPPSRKITKTDLAKYLNAWDQKPELVSLGSHKNFQRFMDELKESEGQPLAPLPDVSMYKTMVAKAILFKKTQSLVRPLFPAFQGNVTIYLISLLANRIGDRIDFEKIWLRQDISGLLRSQLQTWSTEVNDRLHRTSGGKMISEWAKKPECWDAVRSASYSPIQSGIPELR
jgi:hypothetical protein